MALTTESLDIPGRDADVPAYFEIVIHTLDGRPVYSKTVPARDLFDDYVRHQVSDFVKSGLVRQNDHYFAVVIPRYDSEPNWKTIQGVDAAKVAEQRSWLSLSFEAGYQPESPVSYFTVEIRVQEGNKIIRQDVPVQHLSTFLKRLVPLVAKITGTHEFKANIIIRLGEIEDAPREKVWPPADGEALVEIEEVEDETSQLSPRTIGDYSIVETIAHPEKSHIAIAFRQSAWRAVQGAARKTGEVEIGGMLVGNVYGCDDSYLVEISAHIAEEDAHGTDVELSTTFESWRKRHSELAERHPGRRVVGWYHTHVVEIDIQDPDGNVLNRTEFFFSSHDHFMHRNYFRDKWYVAIVLNDQGEGVFFMWDKDRIVRCPGYYIVAEEEAGA